MTSPSLPDLAAWTVLALSAFCCALVLGGNVLLLRLAAIGRRRPARTGAPPPASITLLTVFHNGRDQAERKLRNWLAAESPCPDREIVFYSDGSDDGAEQVLAGLAGGLPVRCLGRMAHEGKNSGMNEAVAGARGEIVVVSDMDAALAPDALRRLLEPFGDPAVGGACGRLIVSDSASRLDAPQKDFLGFDGLIKTWETRIGSITSNTGALFAVRRSLFAPLPPGVTDDLFACLAVVRSGHRFVYVPDAMAAIQASSRTPAHELRRRRRIVCCSLRTLWILRDLLNPLRHGFYAVNLGINKVLRRLLPVFLLGILAGSGFLAAQRQPVAWAILALIGAGAAAAAAGAVVQRREGGAHGLAARLALGAFYFLAGNAGTMLGVIDFARGRKVVKW